MFKKLYLQNETVSKENFNLLYEEYEKILKKHNKLDRRFGTVTRMSDKESLRYRRTNKRLEVIIKHSDKQSLRVLDEKSDLEIALEKELENERVLIKEIEDTQKEVVYTMGAIGESRSQETGKHVKRVAEYSKVLARYYGLSEEDIDTLVQASPMHDIGKVAIPDAILNKPDKLTALEFKVIKEHSYIGYKMLQHSTRPLMQAAAIVAYEHHEKWDGSGYPQGLKENDIHIYGRITALADVFDALGSDRCYKKAWSDEQIFKMFKEEKGKHFDPELIDIFFDNLEEFLMIRDAFQDEV